MSKKYFTLNGKLAIEPPVFKQVEVQLINNFAAIAQRTELIAVPLVMHYEYKGKLLSPQIHKILLRGDAGLQPWAKAYFQLDELKFVFCPESEVLGYIEE